LRSVQIWLVSLGLCRLAALRKRIIRPTLLQGFIAFSLLATQSALSQDVLVPAATDLLHAPTVAAANDSESRTASIPAVESISETGLSADVLRQPRAQEQSASTPQPSFFKRPVRSEIIVEGLASYGNYKIFASGYDMKLFTAGVEYDRHSWGYFLKAQVDYVAEFLPFVLLDKPLHEDIYGNPYSDPYSNPPVTRAESKRVRQLVSGIGFSPIGFRLLWRPSKKIQPYMEAKGGMLGFTHKVPSTESSYENFSLQSAMGAEVKMNQRWGLRLGLFGDFHFSNAFVVPNNPGLDVMDANLGLSYHFGDDK